MSAEHSASDRPSDRTAPQAVKPWWKSLRPSEVAFLTYFAACTSGLYGAVLPSVVEPLFSHAVSAPIPTRVTGYVPRVVPPPQTGKILTLVPVAKMVRPAPPLPPLTRQQMDVSAVENLYRNLGYGINDARLSDIRKAELPVPRVFLRSVPLGVNDVSDPTARKSLFLRTLLPLILKVNEDISKDRNRLLALVREQDRGELMRPADRRWLEFKSGEYGMYTDDPRQLLSRVDIIPPSLALAQAAEETGWGTSRVARLGNALFGQTTWNPQHGVPLPSGNAPDPVVGSIRAFPSLLHAAHSYAHNLNTHRAYEHFRRERALLRNAGQPLDGLRLSGTLLRYSERGTGYISNLQDLIRSNQLMQFENARLATEAAEMASIEEESHKIR